MGLCGSTVSGAAINEDISGAYSCSQCSHRPARDCLWSMNACTSIVCRRRTIPVSAGRKPRPSRSCFSLACIALTMPATPPHWQQDASACGESSLHLFGLHGISGSRLVHKGAASA